MSWKTIGQPAATTAEQPKHQALQELDGVKALIEWSSIEAKLSDIHARERGEKTWPPLMMFKALLLQNGLQYQARCSDTTGDVRLK